MLVFKHNVCAALFAVALAATAVPPASAQQPDKVYKVGDDGVLSPKLKRNVQPGYTDAAQASGIMGTVVVSFEIDKDGKTRNIKVVTGLDPGLDKNAVAAVNQWLFEPATKDGQPVICVAQTQIGFKLQ